MVQLSHPYMTAGKTIALTIWAFVGKVMSLLFNTLSSTLAWKIPWMEEPGRLQSMGSRRVGHDWVTSFHFSLSCIGEGNGKLLQCSCLENPRDGGAWWAAVCGVTQSWTWLKRLSSSSSSKSNVNEKHSDFNEMKKSYMTEWLSAHGWKSVQNCLVLGLRLEGTCGQGK